MKNKLMLMIYLLCCNVIIGQAKFNAVHKIEIKNSVKQLADECTIELPMIFLQKSGENKLSDVVQEGHRVRVRLGYNDELFTEFKGYVKTLHYDRPFRIECEDEMYQLRHKAAKPGVYENIDLSTFLKNQGLEATVNLTDNGGKDVGFTLSKFIVAKGETLYNVLFNLKKDPYSLYSYYDDGNLKIGWAYSVHSKMGETNYTIGQNVVKNELSYIKAEGRECRVKAISNNEDGKKVVIEIGDADATVRTLNFFNVPTHELRSRAEAELKRMKFTGYSGKLVGFGFPRTKAGSMIKLSDKNYKDREGKYLVDAVTITYGSDGYRRENEISYKIN